MKSIQFLTILLSIGILLYSCSKDDECIIDPSLEGSSSEITELASDHHRVYTDIVINASLTEVWDVLTDFDNMSSWSTSFQGLTGDISDGGQVVAIFIFPDPVTGNPTQGEYPHTLIYSEGVEFGWSDPILGIDGITDNHFFRVEMISECQTRFINVDEYSGTDPNITTEIVANTVLGSFNQFNAELKAEIEK